MKSDLAYLLISKEKLRAKAKQLGEKISKDYEGKELVLIGTLKGAIVFYADLARNISIPLVMDFIAVTSYGGSTVTNGTVRILKDLDYDIEGKHVIIVEDIVDTGLTLSHLKETLMLRKPASIKICCCLDKPSRRRTNLKPDYCGFEIPDEFAVGYGMDYNEKYRNLPEVYVLKPEIYMYK